MTDALVGVDFCGTRLKAAAFSTDGEQLYATVRKNTPAETADGYYFDWRYQKKMLFEMLREVVDREYRILAIGMSTCGEAVYPMGEDGAFLDNAIAWYCRRTEEQSAAFHDRHPPSDVYELSFLHPHFSYSAHKMAWYRVNKPDVFQNVDCWLSVNGFVNYLLTGTTYYDYNQAGTTMLFDPQEMDWSDELLELHGVTRETLPPLVESGERTGTLTKTAKRELGIEYDIPVSIGGHDFWCGQFALGVGLGAADAEFVTSTTGTAGGVKPCEVLSTESFGEKLEEEGIDHFRENFRFTLPHVVADTYHCLYRGTVLDYYGALVDFVLSTHLGKDASDLTAEDYEQLQREVESSNPGANGIRVYVAENDPDGERNLDGVNLLDMNASNTRGDVFRAVLEYLNFEDRKTLERAGQTEHRVFTTGGLTKNESFLRIRASLLNTPLYLPEKEGINALGGALLGGVGAGVYDDYEDAADSTTIRFRNVIDPDPELAATYEDLFNHGRD